MPRMARFIRASLQVVWLDFTFGMGESVVKRPLTAKLRVQSACISDNQRFTSPGFATFSPTDAEKEWLRSLRSVAATRQARDRNCLLPPAKRVMLSWP